MRPVDQTTYGPNDGNCLSACIASILELPIEAVPRFMGAYWDDFLPWLAQHGLSASLYPSHEYVPPGFAVAAGPSKRFAGRLHACVAFNGVVVHDPHFSRDGLPQGIVEYLVVHGPGGEPMWFSGLPSSFQ